MVLLLSFQHNKRIKAKTSYSVVFKKIFSGFTWEDHSVYISLTLSTNFSHSRYRPVSPCNVVLLVVGVVAGFRAVGKHNVRQTVQIRLLRPVLLGEPDLVAAEHLGGQQVRVVRGENQLRVMGVGGRTVEQTNDLLGNQRMHLGIQLIHHEDSPFFQRVENRPRHVKQLAGSRRLVFVKREMD